MAEVTEVVAEAAERVAGDALEVAAVSRSISGRDFTIGLVIGMVGGGLASGWFVNKRVQLKYEKIAEDEINEMREHFAKRAMARQEKPDISEYQTKVERSGYSSPAPVERPTKPPVPVQEPSKTENIFKSVFPDSQWDYEAELAQRTPDTPYIIHTDEQYEKEEYTEVTFTYYEGDDILVDQHDKMIEDKDRIVGEENMTKFGHGSGDPNVVYIRNDPLAIEIELIRSKKSYAEEVLGFKHSAPRKKRHFDDEN